MPTHDLKAEIARRKQRGERQLTVNAFIEAFADLGYRPGDVNSGWKDRCQCTDDEGNTYLLTVMPLIDMETGRPAFDRGARRDARFDRMVKLREEIFAVSRESILEV